jgi:thiamine-monophosphate kinase
MAYPQNMHSGSGKSGELAPGETALLEQIRARAAQAARGGPFARDGLRLGIGDDCALLRIGPGEEMAVTTDLAVDGRHFRLAWHSPESIGHRTLARGLSDLAAMGARPVAAFLSLGLPKSLVQSQEKEKKDWVERFLDGFFALAHEFQTPLAGGDLAESPIAVADIVLTGAVRRGKALLRSGARPGDLLYATGALGGAAAALARLAQWAETQSRTRAANSGAAQSTPPRIPVKLQPLLAPHLFPQPRVAQGLWLAGRGLASAAIDLSDGLSTDLAHLCEESHVAAEVDAAALPIHSGASLAQALHGGEDYELLFTAPPSARVPRRIAGVPVTRIGRILRQRRGRPTVALVNVQEGEGTQKGVRGAQTLAPRGWEHFS